MTRIVCPNCGRAITTGDQEARFCTRCNQSFDDKDADQFAYKTYPQDQENREQEDKTPE